MRIKRHLFVVCCAAVAMWTSPMLGQVIHLDDTIIDGSLCVGLDCVNSEDFGFATIRLKENNLRIEFVDTSTSSSFPTQDWIIVAAESQDGGMDFFVIGQPVASLVGGDEFPRADRPGENALICPVPGSPDPLEQEFPPGTGTGLYFDVPECYSRLFTIKDGLVTIGGDLVVEGDISGGSGGPAPGTEQLCRRSTVVIGIEAEGTLICGHPGHVDTGWGDSPATRGDSRLDDVACPVQKLGRVGFECRHCLNSSSPRPRAAGLGTCPRRRRSSGSRTTPGTSHTSVSSANLPGQ